MKKFHTSALSLLSVLALAFILMSVTSCKKDKDNKPSLGKLIVTPQETLINLNTKITARIKVPPGMSISDTIRLVKIAANGNATDVALLLDNGNLASGDEIKGDRVFSTSFFNTEAIKGQIKFKAIAKFVNGDVSELESEITLFEVYDDINPSDMRSLYTVQANAVTQLNTLVAGNQNNATSAINQLASWLRTQPSVKSVEQSGITNLEITYKSGLRGGIVVSLLGDDGLSDARGGLEADIPKGIPQRNTPSLPLEMQTRGKNRPESKGNAGFDPNIIGNRNVFIYAPYEASWRNNERPHIINILDSLACGDFQVNYYTNQSANIAVLYDITSYGMVVFSTHGSGGKSILTGELADTLLPSYQTYKPMMQGANPKIGISKNIVISKNGDVSVRSDVYKIYDSFISALSGEFPQSVILNNSCQSDKTPALRNAFINKGAKTYYGYTETTYGAFCVSVSRDVFITLAKNGKTTGEVSKINSTYDVDPFPTFKINGSGSMKYALSLVNGNFEEYYLGWTRNGDGRIISQLGTVSPTGGSYMGIISTGLGYTTQTGRLSQSFNIPANATKLNMKWNFLSEEFLEFIGSPYQDKFEVVLISKDFGEEVVLMTRTIDGIAAAFGASATTLDNPQGIAGDLIYISPEIVFDRGGVYMTGWQSSTFDISAYKGKCVTLVLRCTDVGDSIYDTAVLLDDIIIN
ncbi:MAG TPA: hypothetical protein PKE03_12605 [Bacteroidales bacterium]|nr:hypothetical protein [Bacteroidales bacterium]